MKSINFTVLGDQSIANDFGKKGTSSDLTLFDRKDSDIIRTWVAPNGFPDKIQPLLQSLYLSEYVIFHVSSLDKFTGEQIVALDCLGKKDGILSHSYDVDESTLNAMIKGTVLENYKKVEKDNLKEEMMKLPVIEKDGSPCIVIDHCFDVKGVGTVVLGKVIFAVFTHVSTGIYVHILLSTIYQNYPGYSQCPNYLGVPRELVV